MTFDFHPMTFVFQGLMFAIPVRPDAPEGEYATHICVYCDAKWQKLETTWRRLTGPGCDWCNPAGSPER